MRRLWLSVQESASNFLLSPFPHVITNYTKRFEIYTYFTFGLSVLVNFKTLSKEPMNVESYIKR